MKIRRSSAAGFASAAFRWQISRCRGLPSDPHAAVIAEKADDGAHFRLDPIAFASVARNRGKLAMFRVGICLVFEGQGEARADERVGYHQLIISTLKIADIFEPAHEPRL